MKMSQEMPRTAFMMKEMEGACSEMEGACQLLHRRFLLLPFLQQVLPKDRGMVLMIILWKMYMHNHLLMLNQMVLMSLIHVDQYQMPHLQ
jgi:hypothetical protein